MCKGQLVGDLQTLAEATSDALRLAKLRLFDLSAQDFVDTYGGEAGIDENIGLLASGGLLLKPDLDELIYTGGKVWYVVQTARKCGHRTLTLFEGFDQEYKAPKRCPSCRWEHTKERNRKAKDGFEAVLREFEAVQRSLSCEATDGEEDTSW